MPFANEPEKFWFSKFCGNELELIATLNHLTVRGIKSCDIKICSNFLGDTVLYLNEYKIT